MLSLVYLAVATLMGDLIARRAYRFLSLPHRFGVAFLVGLVLSTWITYLGSLAFAETAAPMTYGNVLFFVFAGVLCSVLYRLPSARSNPNRHRAPGRELWDWVAIGFYMVMAAWLMYVTFGYRGNELLVNGKVYGDFGPNLTIVQNFVWGHNFPTEYPFFSGPLIQYHFLFYFQVANMEYLGLNLAHSLNILSVLSVVAMLIMVMVLGEMLFASRAVGRIAGVLFFFHSTLAYFTFLRTHGSPSAVIQKLLHITGYIFTELPLEDWGLWTLNVYVNQRHFASAVGILLVVLIFLVGQYQTKRETRQGSATVVEDATAPEMKTSLEGFLFSGFLLGTLVLWNGAVFIAAFVLLLGLFILFPYRLHLLGLGAVTAIFALPQLFYLRSGNSAVASYPQFHWGFVIEHPTIGNVLAYLEGTLGVTSVLIVTALILLSWFHRRLFIAMLSLLAVAFLVQFSPQIVVNHKFINVWIILMNLFSAYVLWRLWQLKRWRIAGRVSASVLFISITLGGIINLFPIRNDVVYGFVIEGDPLINWVRANTHPKDVFLTNIYVHHQILLAGRKIFFGWPVYAWSAGYPTEERQKIYTAILEGRDPNRLFDLLEQHHIAYVAIDESLRDGKGIKYLNEDMYQEYFPLVFEDTDKRYGSLNIYKVPSREEWAHRQ